MIVLNGVVGLCLVLGAGKHFEQTFQGAASALAVLGTLATLALILPNFAEAASGPSYSILQLEGVGLMSLVLWCVFVFVQTVNIVIISSMPQAPTNLARSYTTLPAF